VRKWRYVLILGALVWLMNCAPANVVLDSSQEPSSTAVKSGRVPSVEIRETSYDFGKIGRQNILSHDFKIQNSGTASLEIKKVQSV